MRSATVVAVLVHDDVFAGAPARCEHARAHGARVAMEPTAAC